MERKKLIESWLSASLVCAATIEIKIIKKYLHESLESFMVAVASRQTVVEDVGVMRCDLREGRKK